MKRLRIAVVGAGHLGRIHARLLRTLDEVELVGVVDPVPAARQQVAEECETAAFDDLDGVLGKIDAAVIAAPTTYHGAVAGRLLEAKVHLLVEKPLAATAAEARELVRLARLNHRILQVGHVERFNPAWNAVRGSLGRVLHIEARREGRHTFRSTDIGAVLDLMIHDIDLVLSVVRSELVDVRAFGFSALGGQEDTASAWLTFADGAQAQLSASRVALEQRRTMRVTCEDAWAELDFAAGAARLVRPGSEATVPAGSLDRLTPDERRQLQGELFSTLLEAEDLPVAEGNAILDEQHDFVISVRTRRPPMVTGEAGLAALEAAEQVLAAIRQQTWHLGTSAPADDAPAALPMPKASPPDKRRRRAG